ncbi:MAG: hypothetical protein ACOC2U_04750 [bacterium]
MMGYKFGVCSNCENERLIVNKTHNLCEECNHIRLHGETKFETIKNKLNNKKQKSGQIYKDEETYEKVFYSKPCFCENCRKPLPNKFRDENGKIIARYQYSHILGKGAWPQYRNEVWNIMKNCLYCHQEWDFGEKRKMSVYEKCKELILTKTGRELLV